MLNIKNNKHFQNNHYVIFWLETLRIKKVMWHYYNKTPFISSTYLFEHGFSELLFIKVKNRYKIDAEPSFIPVVTSINSQINWKKNRFQ